MDNIDEFVVNNYNEILEFFSELVSVRTVLDNPTEQYPFGVSIALGQEVIRKYCEINNINYVDFDNYLAYSHYGNNNDYINVLTHLDVVPEGDISRWSFDPYTLSFDSDKIIGRGVIDNKCSIIYGVMTIKYLLDNNIKTSKGIRVIYGNDEESGFRDLKQYKKYFNTRGPNFVFDNLFPVTRLEKGVINFDLEVENVDNCILFGGTKRNVIAEYCEYVLNDRRIYNVVKPGHGSVADSRENAIYNVLKYVDNIELRNIIKIIDYIRNEQWYKENYCSINLGKIRTESNKIIISLEMRYSLNTIYNKNDIFELVKRLFKNYIVVKKNILEPMVFDESLVKYWLEEYNQYYGTNYNSQISGYITYAHLLDNSVSIGPFTESNDSLHCFDEYIYEEEFKNNLKFYIKTLTKYIR